MNLYDKSSLILVPGAVKDGKVYSQRPENGDGDFTFSRASTATRVNENGLIESVSSNTPRLDYTDSSCPSLLLEPQRTNLVTQSEYINGGGLSKIGSSIDTNVSSSPEGLVNASLLKENSSSGSHFAYKDFNLTNGATYTISIFAKSNGENRNIRLGDGGVGWSYDFDSDFDLTLGTSTNNGVIEDYGNGWYRCSVVGTTNAASSRLIIYSTLNTATNYQGDGVSGVYLYGFQIEQGSYATSYIPTYGTSVTRGADSASKTGISSLIGQTEGTLFVELDIKNLTGEYRRIIAVSDGTSSTVIALVLTSIGTLEAYIAIGGTYSLIYYGPTLSTGLQKLAMTYSANEARIYRNGTLLTTDTSVVVPACSNLYLGKIETASTTGIIGNGINQALVFTTALTDSECIELTTL